MPAWPVHYSTRLGPRMFPVQQDLHTIDEYVLNTSRILMRFGKRSVIGDRYRIKDNKISKIAFRKAPSVPDTYVFGRKRSKPSYRFLEWHDFLIPGVLAQYAGKGTKRARVIV